MATPSLIPLVDTTPSKDLLLSAARITPVLVPSSNLSNTVSTIPKSSSYYVLVADDESLDSAISYLNNGASAIFASVELADRCISAGVPSEKLYAVSSSTDIPEDVLKGIKGALIKISGVNSATQLPKPKVTLYLDESKIIPTEKTVASLHKSNAALAVPLSQLTNDATSSSKLNITNAFLAPITTDRPDGLFSTIVSSYLHGGKSLGLCYSSKESIEESVRTGRGVYQSRKHGLWRKGETSGAIQDVVKIDLDCDSDCLNFEVIQHGAGFCHLDTPTCFGQLSGLAALEETLVSRHRSAPEGSYTKRLFNDETLLRSKIMEEADELCAAKSQEDVAFEAADLIYFALTRCVSKGVNLADIGHALDKKAAKVSRRPGNAKPKYLEQAQAKITPAPAPSTTQQPQPTSFGNDLIRMRKTKLDGIAEEERLQLLRRPVLNSGAMIDRVRPIVEGVSTKGDKSLLDFIAKLDKADLKSPIARAPFEEPTIQQDVKEAIDIAYENVRKFHVGQAEKEPLVVETMPGIVCQRFARPISRVGLYVPGGTAILPSSALMLGVPAQVAGCKEIVLATPPKPDGSIAPEVLYVAKKVGASAILKAGGAQAVAALAYGTETVPKVDKIFGPGNQWVTAAKMFVSTDADAQVAIDMPAGPSEVLVIADKTANASYVASDLLSQAEHGVDSQVVLVTIDLSEKEIDDIEKEVEQQARKLPRVDITRISVSKSLIVSTSDVKSAFDFSNDYAPEHLILHIDSASEKVPMVENAGSVFVGQYSPESCGDYASGTNHTLPTNGFARQYSGVNTLSFQKHITSQELTKEGLDKLGPVVVKLAECEGLRAHANAVRVRLGMQSP
ncbi:Histidine biosynthesis trifunctional protein [Wallemia ichthyophaga EXF-994]|uniref:Histidine biosynthesis trifunctional protein n=1 Tax=Wallemia ichthyophaga (strain EXF-994 / CBS 113033) TaxID=1299270 RepID=R9AE11_WALI9|nr:Histidine biosynthesis trifunctional protein [Wallemia ichthyophaga EXF-994]EOR00439.1 Histidine biosynthesis trifunctional protein [Wallemia ichthyophaga EXF-994]